MRAFTIGHGARSADELLESLAEADVRTLADVRRFPGSRRHPQFARETLAAAVEAAGIPYHHVAELGGREERRAGGGALLVHRGPRVPELRGPYGHARVAGRPRGRARAAGAVLSLRREAVE